MNSNTSYLFRIHTACLVVLATMAIGVMLYWLRPVLVPFVLALFFVSGLNPILRYIERRLQAPRMVAVGVTLMLCLAIVGVLWALILASVTDLVRSGDAYQQRFNYLVQLVIPYFEESSETETDDVGDSTDDDPLGESSETEDDEPANTDGKAVNEGSQADANLDDDPQNLDEDVSEDRASIADSSSVGSVDDISPSLNETDQDASILQPGEPLADDPLDPGELFPAANRSATGFELAEQERLNRQRSPGFSSTTAPPGSSSGRIPDQVSNFLGSVLRTAVVELTNFLVELISSGTIVLIFVFFLLMGGSRLQLDEHEILREIDSEIRNYIVAKTLISIATGFIYGFVLWIFGVPLSIVLGLLAFMLNYIPNVGPLIACLLPIPLVVLNPEMSIVAAITVIVLSSTIQFVSGNVVEPKMMGSSLRLDPIAILLALMFWGMTWGIVGMFLATPMLSATKILCEKFELTQPIADIIAGRPPRSKPATEENETVAVKQASQGRTSS